MTWLDPRTEIQSMFGELANPSFGGVSWTTSHIENRPARAQGPDYTKPATTKKETPMNDPITQDTRSAALNMFLAELPHYRNWLFGLARIAGLSGEGPALFPPTPVQPRETPSPALQASVALPQQAPAQRPQVIDFIIKTVTAKTGVSLPTILEKDTNSANCRARYLCYHLSFVIGKAKLEDISVFFDRTKDGVRRALERFRSDIKKDDDLSRLVGECAAVIKGSAPRAFNGHTS